MVKTGLRRRNFWVNDLQVDNSISGANLNFDSANVTNFYATNDNKNVSDIVKITNIKAESIISGGMWVVGSAASGTTLNIVAKPATAGTASADALGIALSTTASGTEVPILIKGAYQGLIAAGTILAGGGFIPGSGAAVNTILPVTTGKSRGSAILGASSGASTYIYLY